MTRRHIHLVTGKLAAPSLQRTMEQIGTSAFDYSIDVLPITVAALMTPAWIAPRLTVPSQATEILLPGHCDVDLEPIRRVTSLPVHVGPKDLRGLPEYFGGKRACDTSTGPYQIEILAEINHAPRLPLAEILRLAECYRRDGADIIDLGCDPGSVWTDVGNCCRILRQEGYRISIDSWEPREIEVAVRGGAELVLSVNGTNCRSATDWGCEVVVIPDSIPDEKRQRESFAETIQVLAENKIPFRLDPILDPIGCGFGTSLFRYYDTRKRYPQIPMLMGIGNLTELTDVDSAGINMLLLGFCAELQIHSVLTTQVIPWAQTSVRECDLARRAVDFSVREGVPPKRVARDLIMLRDDRMYTTEVAWIEELAQALKDPNFRIFVADNEVHLLSAGFYQHSDRPFALWRAIEDCPTLDVDPSHAFYLGYELAKAQTALTLGKQYQQDQALDWGFLTRPEIPHESRRQRTQHVTGPRESPFPSADEACE